ncbi:MAG TPA: GntR family transcriptional regulator [Solirubrobacter sp.]|nr:GntR family transcriptional regulator [Solirubrobacter sp.]
MLQELREDLIRRRYAPGDPIRVDQVAANFGISALPVREAMRVLLAEGRVQYEPHRGYRVTTLTLADVEEIFLMCGLLEAEALRRGVPALDSAGIKRMRSLLGKLLSPPRSASTWELASIHQDFHFVPIEYARLPRLEAEMRGLWDHTDHYRGVYLFNDADVVGPMNDEHVAIADACAAGDAKLAVALAHTHRAHALAHLAEQWAREPAAVTP